ncbi:MAG: hypothetical protein N2712_01030 [Brevinematales bacterium]|nr:hypothetical protein [Brevinematales bacterium]
MLLIPLGLIGVYTSFSKESILTIPLIEKLAIQNGFKAIGIADPNFLWMEKILHLPKSSVIFFPAIRNYISGQNEKIKVYILPRDFSSLEIIGRKEQISIRDLRSLNIVAFYTGSNLEHFKYLYESLLGKVGLGITNHNIKFVETASSKVDYIIPFKYSTAPSYLEKYENIVRKFIRNFSSFPNALSMLREVELLPNQIVSKILYTVEVLKDIRDYEYPKYQENDEYFASLLWKKIVSKATPDEKIKKEFNKITSLGLSEFFYRLLNSFEEFSGNGVITSNLLSMSFIFEKLGLIKINKSKVISLSHILFEKPLHVDVVVSSKEKFLEILNRNFEDKLFHRVYPVHYRYSFISDEIRGLPKEDRDVLESLLKNSVYGFRVSNRLFYSSSYLRKRIRFKDNVPVEFCGKYYDVVLDVKKLEYFPSSRNLGNISSVIKNDKLFVTPDTISVFWNKLRNEYEVSGINSLLKLFYLGKVLALKPYYKPMVDELISQKLPIFVDSLFRDVKDEDIEVLLNILWSRDKKYTGVGEVELFKLLVDNNIDKQTSEKIIRFVAKYKNIVGIKSYEVPNFYNFLSYIRLKQEDEVKFIITLIKGVLKSRRNSFVLFQFLKNLGISVEIDINLSSISKIKYDNGRYILPLSVSGVEMGVLERIVKERQNGNFKNFSEFYARVGKDFPRESNKLIKIGCFDSIDTRENLLRIGGSLSYYDRKSILIRDEFKILGFSLYLLRSNFRGYRERIKVGSVKDAFVQDEARIFGFIPYVDKYGNFFIQDEENTIFVRNRTYTNLKIGDYKVFEVSSRDGFLGKNFFLKMIVV